MLSHLFKLTFFVNPVANQDPFVIIIRVAILLPGIG